MGAGLAAHIIIGKHEDHLPLNRQEKILERHGIILSIPYGRHLRARPRPRKGHCRAYPQ